MQCPVCNNVQLVMSERQGIEIDYCPQCRGVWLDRGELDKLIERSPGATPAPRPERAPQAAPYSSSPPPGYHADPYHGGHYKKKKREGFLSDLFDFD